MPDTNTSPHPASRRKGRLSVAYFGERTITEAELGYLHEAGWVLACPQCGEDFFVHTAAGSPLSGSGRLGGVCASCGDRTVDLGAFPSGTLGRLTVIANHLLDEFSLLGANVTVVDQAEES